MALRSTPSGHFIIVISFKQEIHTKFNTENNFVGY
jgi:hypothetical protein